MKKQYFINANIIDPYNSLNENGGLIIGEDGKIEAIGKKVNSNNLPTREKPIDLKGKYPGLAEACDILVKKTVTTDAVNLDVELRQKAVIAFKALAWGCAEGAK